MSDTDTAVHIITPFALLTISLVHSVQHHYIYHCVHVKNILLHFKFPKIVHVLKIKMNIYFTNLYNFWCMNESCFASY